MSTIRTILDHVKANPEDWEFVAELGTELGDEDSAIQVYLHRKTTQKWYLVGGSWPRSLSACAQSPYRRHAEGFPHYRGPVTFWPEWLKWDDGWPALDELCCYLYSTWGPGARWDAS